LEKKKEAVMKNYSEWFREQLQNVADGFVWGTQQVPESRRDASPPKGLGEWTVARHVYHLWYYEQTIALPSMQQWLGGAIPFLDHKDEDKHWDKTRESVAVLLEKFRTVRAEQIALFPQFDNAAWNTTCEAVWGPVSLLWVVSKTYQHTAEHINDVMRIGLFWDAYLAH
jgi:hypothetical protein